MFNIFAITEILMFNNCLSGVQVGSASQSTECVTSILTVLTSQMKPTVQQNVTSKLDSANGQMLRLETDMTGSVIRVKHPQNSLGHLLTTPITPQQVSIEESSQCHFWLFIHMKPIITEPLLFTCRVPSGQLFSLNLFLG